MNEKSFRSHAPLRNADNATHAASCKEASSSLISHLSSLILDAEAHKEIAGLLSRYPTKQAATLPALHAVNQRLGYVPPQAVVEIAQLLGLAPAQVQDTLSFYGFFKQDKPQGPYRVWVCRSISCAACGGEDLLDYLCEKLNVRPGETTADGRVTLEFAECLGACDVAPAIMVNDTMHGHMTKEKIDELVSGWK
jgi:NADH-quinone oxidoreductase subunit E